MKRWAMGFACIALVVSGFALARPSQPRAITVILPDSAGLFVGNDVGVLGIPVGKVVALEPHGRTVEARLEIDDDDVKIPAGVGAAVVTRSIAADRYMELTPVYDGGATIADGATIPVSRVVTPVDFDRVLASMKDLGDGLASNPRVSNSLKDFVDASAKTLDGNGRLIHDATTSMAGALAEVNGQRHTIVGTVRSLTELARVLNTNEATVRTFIGNLADAASLLSDERLNIGASLTALSASIDDISRLARRNREALKTDTASLTVVLRNTVKSQADLEEALDTLPLVGQNLSRATSNGRLRMQIDPAALTPLGPFVDKLCLQLGPICNAISVSLNPTPLVETLLGLLNGGGNR